MKNQAQNNSFRPKFLAMLFLLFVGQFLFSQSLEDKIYLAIETFTAHPNAKSLNLLIDFENQFKPKTKSEFLALVILNCNKAYYQNQLGQVQNSILSYEKAWRLFISEQLSNYDIVAFCLMPLGNLYTQIGDFDNAENTIKHYLNIANKFKNEPQKISAIQNLSLVYQGSGRADLAIQLLQNALKATFLNQNQKAVLLGNLGSAFVVDNQIDRAKSCFLASIQLLNSNAKHAEVIANGYRNLSKIEAHQQHFDAANWYFKKAKTFFNLKPINSIRQQVQFILEEAQLQFSQNQISKAQQSLNLVLNWLIPNFTKQNLTKIEKKLYPETLLIDSFDLQANLYLVQRDYKKALQFFDCSFEVERQLQAIQWYENSKIISQAGSRNRIEKYLAVLEKLSKLNNNTNCLIKAFQLSEQSKMRVLNDITTQNATISTAEKAVFELIQDQIKIIANEQQKGKFARLEVINTAIEKQNELCLVLKSKQQLNSFQTQVFNVNMIFKQLQNQDAILISYFCGVEKTYCFTLQNNRIQMNSFATNKAKITDFLSYFSDSDRIANNCFGFVKAATSLFDYLHLPANSTSKNWIIIPDGNLNFVPFEALISKSVVTTNFSKTDFLVKKHQISYQNSAVFYCDSKQLILKNRNFKVLGIFPIFEKTNFELSYSKGEIKAIESHFESTFFKNQQATFANFKTHFAGYDILHFCTHASAGAVDEPAQIKFFDKNVSYFEFYNLNVQPNLVVLSACETGLGKWFKGEGAMSVSRGFQAAGAKNVLFSLWKVNDFSTAVFMNYFYLNLKNGNSFAQANQNAKLNYLNDSNISNAKKSPYYWCAMTYYGAVDAQNGVSKTYQMILFFGVLLLIFSVF